MATVRIPTQLRKYTEGSEAVEVTGTTAGEVLSELDSKHPGIRERVFDKEGAVKRFVNIFVGEDDIRFLQKLETPVAEKDEVSIVLAVAGG